ncbi:MAG: hypothetical protein R3E83_16460 [Burkholderiaceae bacterium]
MKLMADDDRLARMLARLLMRVALMMCALLTMSVAQAAGADEPFDHLRTGFRLTGAHRHADCESCHVGGVMQGTPRDCRACHVSGSRLSQGNPVVGLNHVPITERCDSCHTTRTFVGARFRHLGVIPGSCSSCHNGIQAEGKPATHPPTQDSCDSCHRSGASWAAARMDHMAASTRPPSAHLVTTARVRAARTPVTSRTAG